MIPFLNLKAQYIEIKNEIDKAINSVIADCAFSSGKYVSIFEKEFEEYLGGGKVVGCSSGTSALHLALIACGIKPGDEVIIPANTFIATAEAICYTGATPVLIDCNEYDYLLDITKIKAAITDKTKAIIPVHLYGQPADMKKIIEVAKNNNLWVIEDSSQAHGALYKGKKVGTFGDFGTFSFYPGKNLGAYGEAGAICIKDEEQAQKIRFMLDHGSIAKYEHHYIGYNYRMDGIQGAILSVKLKRLNKWNSARRSAAHLYEELLQGSRVVLPKEYKDRESVYHLFVIQVNDRDNILSTLKKKGIFCGIHYPNAIHQHFAFKDFPFYNDDSSYPIATRNAKQILSLPIFPEISKEQIKVVVKALQTTLK